MSEVPPRRFPRALSCLVKGPLGCLSFVLGAGTVTVLLLPPVGGRFLGRQVEQWARENLEGSLEIGDAWIGSLYNPQSIESLVLRDPEHEEVLSARVDAPRLELGHDAALGEPVRVHVYLCRLVATEDGRTNLARALDRSSPGLDPLSRSRALVPGARSFTLPLAIDVDLMRYSDGRGAEGVVERLHLEGTLACGDETRLVLTGGTADASGGVRMRLEFARPEHGLERPWRHACTFEGLPAGLARVLCPELGPVADAAGVRLDELVLEGDGARRAVRAADEGARFELAGELADGMLTGDGTLARLVLPCGDPRAQELLLALVPAMTALECADERATHALELAGGRWPVTGAWDELSGELGLVLAPLRALPVPALREWLGSEAPLLVSGARLNAQLEEGSIQYALFRLPYEHGWIEVDGVRALAGRSDALEVRGERDGQPLAPLHVVEAGGSAPAPPPRPDGDGAIPVPPERDG